MTQTSQRSYQDHSVSTPNDPRLGGVQSEQHLRPLFTTSNQSSGKQSKSYGIMRSLSQSDDAAVP